MRLRTLAILVALTVSPLAAQSTPPRTSPPPAAAAPSPPLEVPYRQFRLTNGLNVILHRDTSVPVVAVNVWYHVGSGSERVGRTGFAHLFEHLMFEGSKHVKEGEFDTLLEAVGGNNNGSTSNDPLPRIGSHGLSPRHDDSGTGRRPARCREERTAAEL
jgi:hypothetical protein